MLTVYKFVAAWGLPDLSPFCIKLETYLRMAGIAYEPVTINNSKAPRNKLPFVRDGERTITDSDVIITHLEATRGVALDRDLSPRDRATAEAFRGMLEESHYFIIMYIRWCTAEGRAVYRPIIDDYCRAAGIPRLLRAPVIALGTVNLRVQAWMQGVARRSPGEIWRLGQRHWDAVADQLDD